MKWADVAVLIVQKVITSTACKVKLRIVHKNVYFFKKGKQANKTLC